MGPVVLEGEGRKKEWRGREKGRARAVEGLLVGGCGARRRLGGQVSRSVVRGAWRLSSVWEGEGQPLLSFPFWFQILPSVAGHLCNCCSAPRCFQLL